MAGPKPKKRKSPARPALDKSIVLVGLMGAGKSSIGRLLGNRLGLAFVDADTEIVNAAKATIQEIFETHGEDFFRSGERRVIARLLDGPAQVIATGGGAFMDADTRRQIKAKAISVWLKADLDTLLKRVSRRGGRPLLKNGDPAEVLSALMAKRDPVYATADVIVETSEKPPAEVTDWVIRALEDHLGIGPLAPPRRPANRRPKTNGSGNGKAANTGKAQRTARRRTGRSRRPARGSTSPSAGGRS